MRRIAFAGAALFALCAAAQEPARVELNIQKDEVKVLRDDLQRMVVEARTGGQTVTMVTSGKGAPYSGDEVTEFSQTLGDGTRIQRQDKVTVYRDSQGRSRRETGGKVAITDPVEGVSYTLDPSTLTAEKMTVTRVIYVNRIAAQNAETALAAAEKALATSRTPEAAQGAAKAVAQAKSRLEAEKAGVKLPASEAGSGNVFWAPADARGAVSNNVRDAQAHLTAAEKVITLTNTSQAVGEVAQAKAKLETETARLYYVAAKSDTVSESLGQRIIEGVVADGTRTTETIPTGAIGNDRPLAIINERWYSPDLQTVVMTRRSDPRTGEEVFRLANIRRVEPPLDLFQAPSSYRVVEGSGGGVFRFSPAAPADRR